VIFQDFIIAYDLPKTRGKSNERNMILSNISDFVKGLKGISDFKIEMKKKAIHLSKGDIGIFFDSTRTFKVVIFIEKTIDDSLLESINTIMNEFSQKLDKVVNQESKTRIEILDGVVYKLEDKNKPFFRIINEKILSEFSQANMKFAHKDVTLATGRPIGKGKNEGFTLRTRAKGSTIEVFSLNRYKGEFPNDMVRKAFRESKESLDRVLKVLMGNAQ